MENNGIKENYLEVLSEKNITTITEPETKPALVEDRSLLLPAIIPVGPTELISNNNVTEISTKLRKRLFVKYLKIIAKALLRFIRACFLVSANAALFAGVAIIIAVSSTIVTKNIVNSKYNAKPASDDTYSIYKIREEEQ